MNKCNTLEQSSVYPISRFLTVVCSSCWSQRSNKNRTWWGCLFSQDAIRVLETLLDYYSFFITTLILHFTFLEVILLIYLFHCFGKSPQSVPTWWKFLGDFLATLEPHLGELHSSLSFFIVWTQFHFTHPHTQGHTSIRLWGLGISIRFQEKWYSKASHWFFDKWFMQKLAWQPTGMNKLIPIKSPPCLITIFFNGQFCAEKEIPTGRSFVSLSQSFNVTLK